MLLNSHQVHLPTSSTGILVSPLVLPVNCLTRAQYQVMNRLAKQTSQTGAWRTKKRISTNHNLTTRIWMGSRTRRKNLCRFVGLRRKSELLFRLAVLILAPEGQKWRRMSCKALEPSTFRGLCVLAWPPARRNLKMFLMKLSIKTTTAAVCQIEMTPWDMFHRRSVKRYRQTSRLSADRRCVFYKLAVHLIALMAWAASANDVDDSASRGDHVEISLHSQ